MTGSSTPSQAGIRMHARARLGVPLGGDIGVLRGRYGADW